MKFKGKATDVLRARPNCDVCGAKGAAEVGGKTRMGPWGYMCGSCFVLDGYGLGVGVGQVLLCGEAEGAFADKRLIHKYQLKEAAA